MRIAIDSRPLQHPHSGIGRYTAALIQRLEQLGCEFIHCSASGSRLLQTLSAQFLFKNKVHASTADLFWSPRHHLPLGLKIPSVVTIHDLTWKLHPQTMPRSRRWNDAILTRISVSTATQIIAVSKNTRDELIAIDPRIANKISIVHEASTVTPARNATGRAVVKLPDDPFVLFVGTLEPRKNLERVMKAYCQCGLKNIRLVVVGNKGWKGIQVPRHDSITHLERVNDQELGWLYAHALCLVAPSLYEGFGLQICEALTFGKAIITSRAGAIPEIAGDAAMYVDPLSVHEISDAIKTLVTDAQRRKDLEVKAAKRSTMFSWDRAANQTLDVFTEAITASKVSKRSYSRY